MVTRTVDEPPARLVYDDDCGFCTWCAEYAAARGEFELVGFSELTPDQRARLPDEYEECAHLLTQNAVYSCGEAIEEALARVDSPVRWPVEGFRLVPRRDRIREPLYRLVADNRDLFGKIVRREPPARTNTDS
ncbi:thiol-disulfide oxidoreductase DCC family protein [Halomontanus rarus]|uniref:thiol-disulfide oxidoreductase DCC family protein n=1 Tax=Halomontanus rarus TaxID=3034020 RepID=UPI0023E7CCDC|nr:DCC1-like thiol-disulfide oxidoreductase family protein [Halovivax sp. TS33]